MRRHVKVIQEVLRQGPPFSHVIVADDSVFVANDLNDMTAFCHLMIRRRQGLIYIYYELCLTVLPNDRKSLFSLRTNIEGRRFTSAHITTSVGHTLDHFVRDGRMTEWLFKKICSDLARYTLDAESALTSAKNPEDDVLRDMRALYDNFETLIEEPLWKLVQARTT